MTDITRADVLKAISVIFNCTIEDLLKNRGFIQESDPSQSKEELRNQLYHPQLLAEIVSFVNDKVASEKKAPTLHQALISVEEIYLHSFQNNFQKIDEQFADWFINLMESSNDRHC